MQYRTAEIQAECIRLLQATETALSHLQTLPDAALEKHPANGGWNALECIEHLNRYAAYYLPALEKGLDRVPLQKTENYRPGWLGEKMAQSMRAEKARSGKMKAPRRKNPAGQLLNRAIVLERFGQDLLRMQQILNRASGKDWHAVRIATSLSPLLRLTLGDTLRFCVYHTDRHMQQALRAAQV